MCASGGWQWQSALQSQEMSENARTLCQSWVAFCIFRVRVEGFRVWTLGMFIVTETG